MQSVGIIICHFVRLPFKSMYFHIFFFFFFFVKDSYAKIIKATIMKNIPKGGKLIKAVSMILWGHGCLKSSHHGVDVIYSFWLCFSKAISPEPLDGSSSYLSEILCCTKQGPVVQSVVSLTSSLRVISLTVLADSIYNILIFFAEKMWVAFALQKLLTFFQQKNSAYLRITRCKF